MDSADRGIPPAEQLSAPGREGDRRPHWEMIMGESDRLVVAKSIDQLGTFSMPINGSNLRQFLLNVWPALVNQSTPLNQIKQCCLHLCS